MHIPKNITLLILILPVFLFAQSPNYRWSVTANINSTGTIASNGLGNTNFESNQLIDGGDMKNRSFNVGVNVSYMVAPDWGLRLKITTTQWNYTAYRNLLNQQPNNPPYNRIDDAKITSADYSFAPGIFYEWRIKKFAIIAGAEAAFTLHNAETYSDIVTQDDPNPANAYKVHNTITVPGGFSAGIGAFMGANYFFKPRLSVGIEISTSYLFTSIGNHTSQTTAVISGTVIQPSTSWYDESISSFQFGQMKGTLNLSYYF